MRLATIRTESGTSAVRIDGDEAVECGAIDVGTLLATADWRARAGAADGPRHPLADLSYAPVVPRPGKIICVGLNYRSHISEMGRELPKYPPLFAKYPEALIGAFDPLTLPAESDQVDWEVEALSTCLAPASLVGPSDANRLGRLRLVTPSSLSDVLPSGVCLGAELSVGGGG